MSHADARSVMNLVALNADGDVVALCAMSEAAAFRRDLGPRFDIREMNRAEACERHLAYVKRLEGIRQ